MPVRKYTVDSAYQGQEGLTRVQESMRDGKPYALAFVDMRMPPGWDGAKTIEELWKVDPAIQVVVCTAYSDYSWEEVFQRFGATDRLLILKKPFDTAEVCQLACALTEKWHLAKRAHLKLSQLHGMIQEHTRDLQGVNQRLLDEIENRKTWEERYKLAAIGANDGLWDWDLKRHQIYYSPRWKAMLGWTEDEVSTAEDEWTKRIHADDIQSWRNIMHAHFGTLGDLFQLEFRMQHKDGQHRWVLCRGTVVRDECGEAIRAAGSITDVTDRKLAEEQLRFEALHDTLTGLANRRLLHDRISHCVAIRERNPDAQFAVLLIDLDKFKVVNDSLGHTVGDALLMEVARRLRACSRKVDTVSRVSENHVARVGGDEFVILLEGIHSPTDAVKVAERVHETLREVIHFEGHELRAFASIGITTGETSANRPEEILRDADTAMYRAKHAGKGCTRIFDPEMHERAMAKWSTETDLRHALEDTAQFVVCYQPIISARGRLVAVEALLRWHHPIRGIIEPEDFIPLAEESGLIVPIGAYVLRVACAHLALWRKTIPAARTLGVSVNVSPRQFKDLNLVSEVLDAVRHAKLEPGSLKIEITESAAMADVERAIATVTRLRSVGVLVHMDDFGTGYSSLSQLHRIPLDALKIDRTFVTEMARDPTSRSIVSAVAAVGHAMNLSVIAEGVETREQVRMLAEDGCDFLQGYLFSEPLAANELAAYIEADQRAASGTSIHVSV